MPLEKRFTYVGFVSIFLVSMSLAFADEVKDIKREVKYLEEQKAQLKNNYVKHGSYDNEKADQNSELIERINILKGINIAVGITFVYQQVHNTKGGSLSSGNESDNPAYSVDLEFYKKLFNQARVFLHFETGDGAGADNKLEVFSPVNCDANDSDNNISITEAWYEQTFGNMPITLMLGRIDPAAYIDTNEYANDGNSQFLAGTFKNSPVIEFSDNSEGIHKVYILGSLL